MSAGKPKGDRDVIPRWRNPRHPATRFELDPLRVEGRPVDRTGLREREGDWQANGTLGFALDLVGTAVVLGPSQPAKEAAKLVLETPGTSEVARHASRRVLASPDHEDLRSLSEPTNAEVRAQIHNLRERLRSDPRNAIAWAEAARHYTILGERGKAAGCMRVAVGLMPDHRYVLRAAVRLAVHHGEFDRGHALVARAPRTPTDPWLVATELATAGPAEARPRFVRHGRRMLEDVSFSPRSMSELASALGTFELRGGSQRRARRLIQDSLRAPNDNAIAQGQWLSKQMPSVEIDEILLGESAEARAIRHGAAMESEQALQAAWEWHQDQPFASGPGELGSYHASVAGKFEEGVRIAEASLKANSNEFLLSNNLAFCLLKLDRANEAAKILDDIQTEDLDSDQVPTFLATRGLFEFRVGNPDLGRRHYRTAIQRSRSSNHRILAKINFAVEEYRAGFFEEAMQLIREVLSAARADSDPEVRAWMRRLPSPDNDFQRN